MRHLCIGMGVLFLSAIGLQGCGASTHPLAAHTTEFRQPRRIAVENENFRLTRAGNIPHQMIRSEVEGWNVWFERFAFDVEFPSLTQQEFERLRQVYGGWSQVRSKVRYTPGTVYHLTDFLPPLVQALAGHRFEVQVSRATLPKPVPFAAKPEWAEQDVGIVANCWGTTYEILRQATGGALSYDVFYAPPQAMKAFLFNKNYLRTVKPLSRDERVFADPHLRNAGLQPGDVLVVGDEWVQHTALFVDDDLFFEKAGAGENALYRLTTFAELSSMWDPTFYGYSYLRPTGAPLPPAADQFGLASLPPGLTNKDALPEHLRRSLNIDLQRADDGSVEDGFYYQIFSVPLRFTNEGKGALPPAAYLPATFRLSAL